MPRCQRTFRLLSDGAVDAATGIVRWRCSYCPDSELYETVNAPDLLQYAALAQAACFRDFGKPEDASLPTVLFWGLVPECVREPEKRQYNLYLQRGSDPYQARLQIGHEMFHRVCSQGKIFHWTHEMLACLFSVRLLRQSGAAEYADQTEREYLLQSAGCSFNEMIRADLSCPPYPPGLYGRAFTTGIDWMNHYGWQTLCTLPAKVGATLPGDLPSWFVRAINRAACEFREHEKAFLIQE